MGLSDWYPFIRRKGYDPALLYHSIIPTITTGQRRLDVLGTCFRAINYAYSNHPQEIANNMLQKDIERFGDKLTMVLYIDGPQAEEKKWTAQVRESGREKAQGRVKASLDTFESRIDSSLRIRKQHFIDIKKGLGSSFYWCLESREHFAEHMRGLGWDVRICTTEADVAIAQDAQPKDIIISCDSDMLGYASIVTLWRPVSKSLILVYYLPELLKTIGLSRTQLTALAVVSRNDYQRNISSLGPATNYGIVRAIGDRPDAREIVSAYLANSQVTTKNTYQETFANSLRVFVECQQTQIEPVVLQPSSQANYETLQKRFKDLCGRRDSLKEAQAQGARSRQDSKVRLRIPRSFNRYRTVESPGYVSKNAPALAPESHSTPAPATQSTPSQDIAHPPLQRTGFPRNRGRFSFKERTRKKVHNPPPKMKQFHQKPYKEPPPLPIKLPREKKSKEEEEETAPSVTKRTTKQGLVRSMAWYHPTTTLEVGTLSANTKRVFFTAPTSTSSSATFSSTIPPSTPPTLTSASTLSTSTAQISTTPNSDQHVLQQEVVTSLQEASRLAAGVKRTSQRLIGQFVDTLRVKMDAAEEGLRAKLLSGKATDTEKEQSKNWIKCRSNALSKDERLVLSYLCVPVKPKDDGVDENDSAVKRVQNNSDIDDKDGSEQLRFLTSFLTYLYSGNYPYVRGASVEAILNKGTGIVPTVNTFIDWLIAGEFYKPPRRRGEINVSMPFTPGYLVRSVSGQLAAELRRMYSNGSHDLYKKVEAMKDRGTLGADIDIRIQDDVSAVENFLYLNKLTNNSRKIIPITSSRQPFVSFSERELASFFWKRHPLKERLSRLAAMDGFPDKTLSDIDTWIARKEPGFIIQQFVCAVAPKLQTSRQRKKAGHRAAVKLLSLDEIHSHLDEVKDKKFDPGEYNERGYISRGSIRTDGFRVQLLAFKLRELQDVRYRRLDENRLPSRLTSTVGGIDYYLQEIRNIFTCQEDIERLMPGVRVEDIKTLTLDGGQACVIGAFAHLPSKLTKADTGKEHDKSVAPMEGIIATSEEPAVGITGQGSAINPAVQDSPLAPGAHDSPLIPSTQIPTVTPEMSPRPVYFNLAVKSKAVHQPMFRFRRWLEGEKQMIPDGEQESVSNIETRLPALKGKGASVVDYLEELEKVEDRLLAFYVGSDHKFKKHTWDMERAKHAEYQLIADRLFKIVGGSIGVHSDPSNPVIIGIGLGKFSTRSGLSSLHSTFLDYFVQKARSLGYLVVGLNEYYTSKKCPGCGNFIAQVDMRRFYCTHCLTYHHRDIMAAENMANIVQGYLLHQERPDYLHPVAKDGSLPWKARPNGPTTSSSTTSASSPIAAVASGSSSTAQARRKRAGTTSSLDQQKSTKASRN